MRSKRLSRLFLPHIPFLELITNLGSKESNKCASEFKSPFISKILSPNLTLKVPIFLYFHFLSFQTKKPKRNIPIKNPNSSRSILLMKNWKIQHIEQVNITCPSSIFCEFKVKHQAATNKY